jgi:ABC-type branched-subunit amino acid transport system ATPase component
MEHRRTARDTYPRMSASPILECRELRKRFGDLVAVDGVSFDVGEGASSSC